jgi:hypothetical protein
LWYHLFPTVHLTTTFTGCGWWVKDIVIDLFFGEFSAVLRFMVRLGTTFAFRAGECNKKAATPFQNSGI